MTCRSQKPMQFINTTPFSLDELYSKLLADGFTALRRGTVLVNANGVILRCNDQARSLLANTQQLRINSERLEFADLNLQREFGRAQAQLRIHHHPHFTQELVLRRDEEFLRPLHLEIRRAEVKDDDLYFILITDLEISFKINLHKASSLFRLTERESTVLKKLAGTLTEPQIAAELSITQNTLRSHRKNIYAKLNINSRVELALLLSALT